MKVVLTEAYVERIEAGENEYKVADDFIKEYAPDHYFGYGTWGTRVIREEGKLFASWNIFNSCD
jgi:hypothetical protein